MAKYGFRASVWPMAKVLLKPLLDCAGYHKGVSDIAKTFTEWGPLVKFWQRVLGLRDWEFSWTSREQVYLRGLGWSENTSGCNEVDDARRYVKLAFCEDEVDFKGPDHVVCHEMLHTLLHPVFHTAGEIIDHHVTDEAARKYLHAQVRGQIETVTDDIARAMLRLKRMGKGKTRTEARG
jgi:hypothetical protein